MFKFGECMIDIDIREHVNITFGVVIVEFEDAIINFSSQSTVNS